MTIIYLPFSYNDFFKKQKQSPHTFWKDDTGYMFEKTTLPIPVLQKYTHFIKITWTFNRIQIEKFPYPNCHGNLLYLDEL